MLGVGNVWGAIEFSPSDFSGGTSGTGSSVSTEKEGITVSTDKGYATTQLRVYSGGKVTISSSNTITAISFTFSGSYSGGLSSSYTNLSTTSWSATTNAQARITKISVTCSSGPEKLSAPTLSEPSSITANSATLSWGNVTNAVSYTLKFGDDEIENATSPYQKTGLTPNTQYTFTVKAIADGTNYSNSDYATAKNFTTLKQSTSITLSEAGVPSSVSGTFYVGDNYTLPTTSSQTCGTKTFVGWSTTAIPTPGDKPTSDFYEPGAQVTLGAVNTFYAVYATEQ